MGQWIGHGLCSQDRGVGWWGRWWGTKRRGGWQGLEGRQGRIIGRQREGGRGWCPPLERREGWKSFIFILVQKGPHGVSHQKWGPCGQYWSIKYAVLYNLQNWALFYMYSTNLSTGPPRPPRPLSYLLLVSGNQEGANNNKRVSLGVRKWSSVLLSVAAKLRVVAERDLGKGKTQIWWLQCDQRGREHSAHSHRKQIRVILSQELGR